MDGLSIGRIVHFVPQARALSAQHLHGDGVEPCQAAMVVQVWPKEFGDAPGVNLIVFRDGSNDNYHDGLGGEHTTWQTSVGEGSADGAPFTFHEPRVCTRQKAV